MIVFTVVIIITIIEQCYFYYYYIITIISIIIYIIISIIMIAVIIFGAFLKLWVWGLLQFYHRLRVQNGIARTSIDTLSHTLAHCILIGTV